MGISHVHVTRYLCNRNRVARNPLYLCIGMKQKEHLPIFGIGPVYVGTMAIMLKPTEEKWLRNLYGTEYDAYCKRVNRTWPWFPKQY